MTPEMKSETLKCFAEALRQEMDAQLGALSSEERGTQAEFHSWYAGFKSDRERILGVVEKRNRWAAHFSKSIENFWPQFDAYMNSRTKG